MIPARKNPFLNWLIYKLLIQSGLRSSFFRVNLRQAAPPPDGTAPVILIANHSSWWDGHLAMALNEERWHMDAYMMIENTQLTRYKFFTWGGAFSVDRHDGRSALASLQYAADLVSSTPRRLLILYPQGEILANDVRPLHFFSGVGHLVKEVVQRAGACQVYSAALRYEFIGEQKPEAFISVGPPTTFSSTDLPAAKAIAGVLETELTSELDRLHADVVAYRLDTFEPMLSGGWSINRLWDALRGCKGIKQVGRER